MAYYYDTTDPEVVKLWSKMLWSEYRKKDALFDPAYGFAGKSEDNLFWILDETQKGAGDKITTPYSFQIESAGVVGNEVLEGKEVNIDTTVFSMFIDKQRFGVRTGGEMNQQRVSFDTVEEGKRKLADLWKTRRAVVAMNHLCGNTAAAGGNKYDGFNGVSAPDSLHIYRPGTHTTDELVQADTTATLDVDLIDELVTISELLTPPIRPFIYKGNPYYALFIHPNHAADLRDSSSQWYATMQNALSGGAIDDNPLFSRALGKWRNTIIFSDPHVCQGIHSTTGAQLANTRRAVFCGAGALALAYGRHYGMADSKFRWFSSTWDHGDKYYCSASLIWGAKAVEIDVAGTDRQIGKIVLTTYSAERVAGLGNVGQ